MISEPRVRAAIEALTAGDPPRVWSLLVTVFGDLGHPPPARFSGALLRRITEPIGVRPEALRVALHRLRKEGWITSTRSGRHSHHAVTAWGQAQIAEASPRIYARSAPANRVFLLLTEPGAPDPAAIPLRSGTFLSARQAPDCLCTEVTDPLPDWARARLLPAEAMTHTNAAITRLRAASNILIGLQDLPPLDSAILRILIVHTWRRVALRAPTLPDHCLPHGCEIPHGRRIAMDLLDQLPPPSLSSLDAATVAA